jgi:hypothetical protein
VPARSTSCIQFAGDTASARAYVLRRQLAAELPVYHDRYQRTPNGWRFTERVDKSSTWTPPRWRARRPRSGGLADGVEPSSAGSPGTSAMKSARPSPTGVRHESAVTDWGHGDACMADRRESGGGE